MARARSAVAWERNLLAIATTGPMGAFVTTPAGAPTSRVTDAKDGFTFSLPTSWQEIALSGDDERAHRPRDQERSIVQVLF